MGSKQHRSPSIRIAGRKKIHQRRGAVIAFVTLSMLVIMGFAALTIDSGRLYLTRAELQNAADASALSAATAMYSTDNQSDNTNEIHTDGYARATDIAGRLKCSNKTVQLAMSEVTYGRLENSTDLSAPFKAGETQYNAVHVIAKRTTNSLNGPLELTLARIWGKPTADVSATAVAILDDHMATYTPPATTNILTPGPLIPFTVALSEFDTQAESGTDDWTYDSETQQMSPGPDGIPEVRMFPYANSGEGNFGILNIGVENQGEPAVELQVLNGVSQADLLKEVGTSELSFVDDAGAQTTYSMTGNPGVKVGMEPALQARIGDVIGFAVHTDYTLSGSNATYTVVGLRFGVVMEVALNGSDKRVIIQPVMYTGSDITTHSGARSTDSYVSRVRLAR